MRALILIALAVTLTACSSGENKNARSAAKSYSDTLASAPEKARAAAEKATGRNAETEKMIKDMER